MKQIEIFGRIYQFSWKFPWIRRVRIRRLKAKELKKFLATPLLGLSDQQIYDLSWFYCIVCREMKNWTRTGGFIGDREIGGSYCQYHPREVAEKLALTKLPGDYVYGANRQGEWWRCTKWEFENELDIAWKRCDPPEGWEHTRTIEI